MAHDLNSKMRGQKMRGQLANQREVRRTCRESSRRRTSQSTAVGSLPVPKQSVEGLGSLISFAQSATAVLRDAGTTSREATAARGEDPDPRT
jgi:hypothetical protein